MPAPACAHIPSYLLHEMQGAGDVSIEHPLNLFEILIEESVAKPAAGVGDQNIDRTAANRLGELLDPLGRGKISLHSHRVDTARSKTFRRILDLPFVRRYDYVEAMRGAFVGQIVADAGRGASDDREFACVFVFTSTGERKL